MGHKPMRRPIEPARPSRLVIITRSVLLVVLITAASAGLEHHWVAGAVTGVILAVMLCGPDYYKHYW